VDWHFDDLDAVLEFDALNDFGQLISAWRSLPITLPLSARFDDAPSRTRSRSDFTQMVPVLGGEVEEGEQRFPIFGQAGDRLAVLGTVFVGKHTSIAASAAARVGAPYI
jgi:hypothetical protein